VNITAANTASVVLQVIVLILSLPPFLSSSLFSAFLALSCVPRSFLCPELFVQFFALSRPSSISPESHWRLYRLKRLDLSRGVEWGAVLRFEGGIFYAASAQDAVTSSLRIDSFAVSLKVC
jgi:hypothetical protein